MIEYPSTVLQEIAGGVLIVSGSRSIKEAPDLIAGVVKLAQDRRWAIACGDAAGVDSLVITRACAGGVPLVVLGCEEVGYIRAWTPSRVVKWLVPGGSKSGHGMDSCFIIRDWHLAILGSKAPAAGFCGVWDGKSKGTETTARMCEKCNVPGMLINAYTGEKRKWEKREDGENTETNAS